MYDVYTRAMECRCLSLQACCRSHIALWCRKRIWTVFRRVEDCRRTRSKSSGGIPSTPACPYQSSFLSWSAPESFIWYLANKHAFRLCMSQPFPLLHCRPLAHWCCKDGGAARTGSMAGLSPAQGTDVVSSMVLHANHQRHVRHRSGSLTPATAKTSSDRLHNC